MLTFLAVLWTVIKILLFVLLGLVLLTVLLLSLRYGIELSYTDEQSFRVRFKLLFFRYTIYPRKIKKINPKKYSLKKYEKRLEKQRLKKEKHEKEHKPTASPKKKRKRSLLGIIRFSIYLLKKIPPRFFRILGIDIAHLHITVGCEDAAKTAVRYGYISQTVAYLLELLSLRTRLSRRSKRRTHVTADFLGGKTKASARVTVSIRPIRLIPFGIYSLYHFKQALTLLSPQEEEEKNEGQGAEKRSEVTASTTQSNENLI